MIDKLIHIMTSIVLYIAMTLVGDKNAIMTSVLYMTIMVTRDNIVKVIKETKS